MTDRIHVPTFVWGAVLTAFGIVFTLEALDVWEFSLGDLRYDPAVHRQAADPNPGPTGLIIGRPTSAGWRIATRLSDARAATFITSSVAVIDHSEAKPPSRR